MTGPSTAGFKRVGSADLAGIGCAFPESIGGPAMTIQNRLTQMLGIEHPVLLAPMDLVSGGRLAAAVSQAGGLGLLGGGDGDGEWIDREWGRAGIISNAGQ